MKTLRRGKHSEHIIEVPRNSTHESKSFDEIMFVLGISPSNHTYYSFFENFSKKFVGLRNYHFMMNPDSVIEIGHHYSTGFKIAIKCLEYIFHHHNDIRELTGGKALDLELKEFQLQEAIDQLPNHHKMKTKRDRKKAEKNKKSMSFFASRLDYTLRHIGEGKSIRELFFSFSETIPGIKKEKLHVFQNERLSFLIDRLQKKTFSYELFREVYLDYLQTFYHSFKLEFPDSLDRFVSKLVETRDGDSSKSSEEFRNRVERIGMRLHKFVNEIDEVEKLIHSSQKLRTLCEERLMKHFSGSHKYSKELDLAIQISNLYFFPPKFALQRGKARKGITEGILFFKKKKERNHESSPDLADKMIQKSYEYFVREVQLDIIHFLDIQLISGIERVVYLYPMKPPCWEELYKKYSGAEYWEVVKKVVTNTD